MAQWQDIESAPKDGTTVLGWSPLHRGSVFLVKWDDNRYAAKPRPYWSFSDERLWGVSAVRQNQPTHWMPLPSPPVNLVPSLSGEEA